MREGLAATLPNEHLGNDSLSALIQYAEDEKRKLVPHCYECAAPCGKNNNYDMRRLFAADKDICSLKLLILCGICSMATYACHAAALGRTDHEINRFFYQAFFEKYSRMARSQKGLAGAGEWHKLKKLLPDFRDKRMLDLGCGYGWHCKHAADHGAVYVLGTDISKRMLAAARTQNPGPCIEYRQAAMEEPCFWGNG